MRRRRRTTGRGGSTRAAESRLRGRRSRRAKRSAHGGCTLGPPPSAMDDASPCSHYPIAPGHGARGVCVSAPAGWGPRSCADRQEVSTWLLAVLRPRFTPRGSLFHVTVTQPSVTVHTSQPHGLRAVSRASVSPHLFHRRDGARSHPALLIQPPVAFPSHRRPPHPSPSSYPPRSIATPPPKTLLLPAPHLLLCRTTRLRPEAIILTV